MKKLIISGLLLVNVLSFSYAQEPVTPSATTTPAPGTTPAPAATPTATATPVPASEPAKSTADEPGYKFGFKVTPTYNWFSVDRDGYSSDGGYVGYTYGIMADFRLSNNYYINTGLEIAQGGGKYKSDLIVYNDFTKSKGSVTQRLKYLSIPLTLKLKTNEIGYMRYYGAFGLLTGILIKANEDKSFDDSNLQDTEKKSNMSDFEFLDFGLNIGAGIEYNIAGNTSITVGLQYHNSFVDVWKVEKAQLNPNFISLNFGVYF